MKKVIFLTTIPSPYRVAFFNEWGKYCDLTVIFEKRDSFERNDLWKNVDVQNFHPIFLKGVSVKANKAFCPGIIKVLSKREFEVLIIGGYNTPTAMLASEWLKWKKIPYILSADGGYIKKDTWAVKKLKKHYISAASMWICTSEKTKRYFLHYGAFENKIYKYPFTSLNERKILEQPLSHKEKKDIKKKLGISEEKVVLTVGQFIHRKGFDVLLKASQKFTNDIGVYLVGGSATETYNQIIRNYHLKNIHFLDFMKSDDLAEYYKAADVFVFPTREDIWGLVINEAAAYGLPIVTTTECMAGTEMVKEVNGKIIEVDNIEQLSNAVISILNDERLKNEMSKASILIAREYTFENMSKVHMSVIEEFCRCYGKREVMG